MFGRFPTQAPPLQPPPRQVHGWPAGAPLPNEAPVNGMNRVIISEYNRNPSIRLSWVPIDPAKDRRFHLLASAINVGLEWLETQRGRSVLRGLGREALAAWTKMGIALPQPIDPNSLDDHVDYFLGKMRQGFPNIWISPNLPRGSIAGTQKHLLARGLTLNDFRPDMAFAIHFNENIVNTMADNDAEFWRPIGRRESESNYEKAKEAATRRHQRFQFLFATAAFHELFHCFIAFLAQNPRRNTPPGVDYLDYAREDGGEAGRWAEQVFFGGSIEIYIDPKDGLEHIYVLKEDEVAWKILPATIREFLAYPRRVNETPALAAPGVRRSERAARGFRSLGHTVSPPASVATHNTMIALDSLRSSRRYNLRIQELRQLAQDPRVDLVAILA